ncbi:hypothetical protein CEP52_015543 [Fusarium oligoseptatum]|uniref:F-box domain-containing protein n=1 Tax=Fusarium oligoseptatum TaxID=2604345 RepID=A0A428SC65_9HYPO|nr:hypothetical protein CEP52_015543 [Fusarium oligoseptatum]
MYHHCILCGVRIQPQPDPPEGQLIWRSKIRAVRSERGRSSVFLTGIGYLSQDCLRASDNPDVFYADSPQDLKSYALCYSASTKSRTFIFHESCWQILLSQLGSLTDRPQEPRQIAVILFDLLFCLPRDRFHVSFPAHDFGGALEICSSPQGLPYRWQFLLADPNALRTYLPYDELDATPDLFQSCSDDTQDLFSRFPLEVNQLIFDFLPSQDLCNLRLSSRKVAGIAKPTLLPQSFWASRFVTDKEMNFFPLQEYLFKACELKERLAITISVSFITFDCTEYVSGIRVLEVSGADRTTELSRAGLIMPFSEQSIILPPKTWLAGIQVASSISGIVGIGFLLGAGVIQHVQRTAGIINNPPDGVGIATLKPSPGYRVAGFLIGLDACKFVSLQLLELLHNIDLLNLRPGLVDPTRTRPWFWHPAEPNHRDRAISLHMPSEESQRSISTFALDMNFGGTDGSRLSYLNRIVAFHDDRDGLFRGFAFFYTDGSEKAFGMKEIINTARERWTCIEQSIALDGPGGERIVNLGLVGGNNTELGDHPQVIKMHTNHGRTLEFRRWHFCRLDGSRLRGEARLFCKYEEIITGILVTAQLPSGNLRSLGLRCLAGLPSNARMDLKSWQKPDNTRRTFPMSKDHWKRAPRVFRSSNSCYTSVVLSNIRRVGVSAGLPGRTRGLDHISGLCFEFWDSKVPVYVGQWFQQVGTLSLEPDERIASFTFWQSQESHPNNDEGENSGRITGVQICTVGSGGKQGGIYVGGGKHMLVYSFAENPYEKLSGLAWSFDHQCDYIYDFTQPRLGTSLRLHDTAESSPNSRMPGKIFWKHQDHNGNWLHVSSIQAFFNDNTLSGFIFEYGKTGIYSKVGHVEGDRVSMGLEAGERITRMVVRTISGSIGMVTFGTNRNIRHQLFHDLMGLRGDANWQDYPFGEPHKAKKLDTPSSRQNLATLPKKDGENCVGIWLTMKIFPRATDLIDKVGPIFQKV